MQCITYTSQRTKVNGKYGSNTHWHVTARSLTEYYSYYAFVRTIVIDDLIRLFVYSVVNIPAFADWLALCLMILCINSPLLHVAYQHLIWLIPFPMGCFLQQFRSNESFPLLSVWIPHSAATSKAMFVLSVERFITLYNCIRAYDIQTHANATVKEINTHTHTHMYSHIRY